MTSATFKVFNYDNSETMLTEALVVTSAGEGLLYGLLSASQTDRLEAISAPVADRSYTKSHYHATIDILFSNSVPINIYIDQVFVNPKGV